MMGVGAKRALGLYRSCAPVRATLQAALERSPDAGELCSAKSRFQRYAIFFFADHNPVVSKNTNDLKTGAPDRRWI